MESMTGSSLRDELRFWVQGGLEEGEDAYDAERAAARKEIIEVWEKKSKSLGLSWKKLTNLPEALRRFNFLQRFNVSGNHLDTMPDYIQTWQEVKELNFADNLITELPEWIQTLRRIKILDLRNNCLTYQTLSPLKNMCSRGCKVYVGGQITSLNKEELDDLNNNAHNIRFIWEKSHFPCCC